MPCVVVVIQRLAALGMFVDVYSRLDPVPTIPVSYKVSLHRATIH